MSHILPEHIIDELKANGSFDILRKQISKEFERTVAEQAKYHIRHAVTTSSVLSEQNTLSGGKLVAKTILQRQLRNDSRVNSMSNLIEQEIENMLQLNDYSLDTEFSTELTQQVKDYISKAINSLFHAQQESEKKRKAESQEIQMKKADGSYLEDLQTAQQNKKPKVKPEQPTTSTKVSTNLSNRAKPEPMPKTRTATVPSKPQVVGSPITLKKEVKTQTTESSPKPTESKKLEESPKPTSVQNNIPKKAIKIVETKAKVAPEEDSSSEDSSESESESSDSESASDSESSSASDESEEEEESSSSEEEEKPKPKKPKQKVTETSRKLSKTQITNTSKQSYIKSPTLASRKKGDKELPPENGTKKEITHEYTKLSDLVSIQGKEVYCNMQKGFIEKDWIRCQCCKELFIIGDFCKHAGKQRWPWEDIALLENDNSLQYYRDIYEREKAKGSQNKNGESIKDKIRRKRREKLKAMESNNVGDMVETDTKEESKHDKTEEPMKQEKVYRSLSSRRKKKVVPVEEPATAPPSTSSGEVQ